MQESLESHPRPRWAARSVPCGCPARLFSEQVRSLAALLLAAGRRDRGR